MSILVEQVCGLLGDRAWNTPESRRVATALAYLLQSIHGQSRYSFVFIDNEGLYSYSSDDQDRNYGQMVDDVSSYLSERLRAGNLARPNFRFIQQLQLLVVPLDWGDHLRLMGAYASFNQDGVFNKKTLQYLEELQLFQPLLARIREEDDGDLLVLLNRKLKLTLDHLLEWTSA